MDQRWIDLIDRVNAEGFAEVVWRFPGAPRRRVNIFVLSPEPGTDLGVLDERIRRFFAAREGQWPCWPPNGGETWGESEGGTHGE